MTKKSIDKDDLGDRMKMYEGMEAGRRFIPMLPIIARMDGRSFHTFTKGLHRPFDPEFSLCMTETVRRLVAETNACMGYTQSDEITLAWHSTDIKKPIWFDGRISKMTSQLAALTTLYFFNEVDCELGREYADKMPTFDARVWQVPNRTEGANAFLWREWDATKNSISMAAQSLYSQAELNGKNGSQMQEMMFQKGVNWNDYPAYFKRGTYVKRVITSRKFTTSEIDQLPPMHTARTNPDLIVTRSEIKVLNIPPINMIEGRENFIFGDQHEEF